MILISVNIPEAYLVTLENMVKANRFPNRAEGIRCAIRDLIREEFYRAQYDMKKKEFKDMNSIRYHDPDGDWITRKVLKTLG